MYALEHSVRESFLRARQDIEALRQENAALKTMVLELKEQLAAEKADIQKEASLKEASLNVSPEPQPVQASGDIKTALKEVLAEFQLYENQLYGKKQAKQAPSATVPSENILGAAVASPDSITRFGLDKKAVIKAKILEIIEHAPVVLPRLKEIIVDQQQYCSKASFYRYFEELQREERVSSITVNGRNVVRSGRMEVYH